MCCLLRRTTLPPSTEVYLLTVAFCFFTLSHLRESPIILGPYPQDVHIESYCDLPSAREQRPKHLFSQSVFAMAFAGPHRYS